MPRQRGGAEGGPPVLDDVDHGVEVEVERAGEQQKDAGGVDPKLRPFIARLADVLVADLLKGKVE